MWHAFLWPGIAIVPLYYSRRAYYTTAAILLLLLFFLLLLQRRRRRRRVKGICSAGRPPFVESRRIDFSARNRKGVFTGKISEICRTGRMFSAEAPFTFLCSSWGLKAGVKRRGEGREAAGQGAEICIHSTPSTEHMALYLETIHRPSGYAVCRA